MPMFWGDYHRDTQHLTLAQHGAYLLLIAHSWQHGELPGSDKQCANVTRQTVRQWKAMKPIIMDFFRKDGSHERIEKEIDAAERKIMQRRLAGQKGGYRSGIVRAIKASKQRSKIEANGEAKGVVCLPVCLPRNEATANQPHPDIDSSTNSESERRRPASLADVVRAKGWAK